MSINLNVQGNTQPLEAAVQAAVNRIRKTPIKITVDDRGATQPLGNMKRGADEFSKSMEAANARIIAFGASMAIINGVADGFKALVKNVVEVEKALADINVVMNLSTANLEKFSNGLFKTAKETGAAFNVAAEAATEYARQGLTMEESLKRTRDALILTRLTGMDSANAVKALTAAMNTYGDQIKDTTQLVSKFAAVDVKFAVSAEDFADAISRTGQAAKSAGVDIDELVGLVTAAQQKTARGGKVIGNSFKTIFTRIGRTDTLNQLENLGIAVRDLEGNTIGARRILTDLANTFDHLTESQKAQIAQTVGGVFQINILKAVLSDAAKQNGILANATQISAGATTEAIDKNDQLRQTMSAMATETGIALKELSAQIGEIMLAPGMEKVLNVFKGLAEGANEMLGGGESTGSDFAQGFLKGLGNIITGPGLVVISAVFIKLFAKALVYANQSLQSLIGVTSEAHKQKAIQTSLVTLFGQNAAISKEMLRTDISRTEKEKIILGLLKAQVVEANMLNSVSKSVASSLYTKGYNASLAPRKGRAGGHIPNFADPEREQAARGGYAAGTIRSMNMPGEGSVIYNSAEKVKNFKGMSQPAIMPPHSSKAGKNYQQAFGSIHGFDPYAAGGYIPNYARVKDVPNTYMDVRAFKQFAGIRTGASSSNTKATGAYNTLRQYAETNKLQNLSPAALVKSYKGSQTLKSPKKSLAAMLVPPEGYSGKPFASYSDLTWPVYSLRPDAQTDPSLSKMVEGDFKSTGSKYASRISKVLERGPVSQDKIWKTMQSDTAGGAKGAWKAAVGALFEAAVNSALDYSASKRGKDEGDFDVRGGDVGLLSKAFDGFPDGMTLADYKSDDRSPGNKASFRKKVLKQLKFNKSQQQNKLKPGNYASGFIPNFADPLSDAIGREKAAGVPVSQIRVGSHPALMGKSNPIGLGVTNTHDEPNGLRDVIGAAGGFVPNYAPTVSSSDVVGYRGSGAQSQAESNAKKYNKAIAGVIKRFETGRVPHKKMQEMMQKLGNKYNVSSSAQDRVAKKTNQLIGTTEKLKAATQRAARSVGLQNANSRFARTRPGKMLGSTGGQMALMMGLPMAAGFAKDAIGGSTGAAVGGALEGAGSGAAMGMMFGPLGTALGAAAGGLYGLLNASEKLKEAQDEASRVTRESSVRTGAALGQSLAPALAKTDFGKGGTVNFSFAGKQRELDVDNFNELSAKDPSKSGGFGMRMGADLRGQMLGGLSSDISDILKKPSRGRGSSSTIFKELKKSGINLSEEQVDEAIYTGKKLGRVKDGQIYEKYSKEEQLKNIEDQIIAKMGSASRPEAIKAALDQLPKDMKIQTAALKEGSTAGGRSFKKGDLEYFTPEELKKQIDQGDITQVATAYGDILKQIDTQREVNAENNKGLILQLDLQKLQVAAQQAAVMNQLKIKGKYSKIADNLSFEQKIMGSFATDLQKSQNKYLTSLNKARETKALSAAKADDALRSDIQGKLKTGQYSEIETNLKKELFKEGAGTASEQDVTDALALKNGKELLEILNRIKINNKENTAIQNLVNQLIDSSVTKRNNELDVSNKIFRNTKNQINREKVINDILAKRKQYIDDINRGVKKYSDDLKADQTVEDFEDKLAKSQRLTAFGPGYKSGRERENFQMREKEIDLEKKLNKIRGTRSADILKLDSQKAIAEKDNADMLKLGAQLDPFSMEYIGGSGKDLSNEIAQYETLKKSAEERQKVIDDHEGSVQRIKNTTEAQITVEKKLLEEEKKRLKLKREYETGPGAMRNGARDAQKRIVEQAETMEHRLGDQLTNQFRDGLVDGMQAAINKADDLSDVMNNIAMNFLGAIQQAYLGKAADAIVGALPFSSGGGVRKYSKGGGVPAMVTNGEYVMGRDAVKKYGGGFMHRLNAGGKLPGYSTGGKPDEPQPGSALAANFGGGEGYNTGRRYQSQAMSGFFYSGQSGNLGLQEDTQYTKGIIQERMRKEAEKKAKKRALMQMIVGTALSVGIGSLASAAIGGGGLTADAKADGYTNATPAGVKSATQGSMKYSLLPGADATGFDNVQSTRSFNPFKVFGSGSSVNDRQFGSNNYDYGSLVGEQYSSAYRTAYRGGKINGYADGGHIAGKSGIDQIPAMLSEGEYVIRASSARQLGKPMLDRINAGKFNDGGAVTPLTENSETGTSGGNTNNINITVNMDKGSGKSEKKDDKAGANPKDSSEDQEKSTQLAEKVKQQVISVIMDEQRPGGLLSD